MTVPSCTTCRHSVPGKHPHERYLRCSHSRLSDSDWGDTWYASVIRGFETDEKGRPWCGAMGVWHEPNDEDQTA